MARSDRSLRTTTLAQTIKVKPPPRLHRLRKWQHPAISFSLFKDLSEDCVKRINPWSLDRALAETSWMRDCTYLLPMNEKKIVIIGAGPTGLGAAYRLHELGYENWVLYEKSDYVGGHASSHVDPRGFVWDEGGHVIFSHYPYFDKLIEQMLGGEENQLVRESWIVSGESWVPYPLQNNLRYFRNRCRWIVFSERLWRRRMGNYGSHELPRVDPG